LQLPFFIAKRYFFSREKKSFINFLSVLAFGGVLLCAWAFVVILSVFNGLEGLTRQLHTTHNPELEVTVKEGKTFLLRLDSLREIEKIPHVKAVTEVIQDNALLRYGESQMAVNFKGVSENFREQYDLGGQITNGDLKLLDKGVPRALLGVGVFHQLSVSLFDEITPLVFWYPKRGKKTYINPMRAFNRMSIRPGGAISIEQQFDVKSVLVPISFARKLTDYEREVTALEIKVTEEKHIAEVQEALKSYLGEAFAVKNSDEQQASILRAFKIERLFAFVALTFVLGISSFNIFFSLAVLVVDKRKDLAVLKSLGMPSRFLGQVFLLQGAMIGLSGVVAGLALGFLTCWVQQTFELVPLGVQTQVTLAYPVEMRWEDFGAVFITTFCIALLAAWVPARRAARTSLTYLTETHYA